MYSIDSCVSKQCIIVKNSSKKETPQVAREVFKQGNQQTSSLTHGAH